MILPLHFRRGAVRPGSPHRTAASKRSSSDASTAPKSSNTAPPWTRVTTGGSPSRRGAPPEPPVAHVPGTGGDPDGRRRMGSAGAPAPEECSGFDDRRVQRQLGPEDLRQPIGPVAERVDRGVEKRPERNAPGGSSGSRASRRVASSAASVILSTRRARISGSDSTRATAVRRRPAGRTGGRRGACRPSRGRGRRRPRALGHGRLAGDSGGKARAESAPEPMSSIASRPRRWRQRGQVGDGDGLGEADDPDSCSGGRGASAAVSGPIARA